MAEMLALGLIISQAAQVQAEMVNVSGTKYYIFPETLKYDSNPTHEGLPIKNACNFSVEATNNNYKYPDEPYIHVIYHFYRNSDKTWSFRTNDENIMPPAI